MFHSYCMLNNQMVKKLHWNIHYLGNLCIKLFFFLWWFLEPIQGFIKTKPQLRSGELVIPMLHPPDHRRIPIVHRKLTWGKWHFLLTLVILYITLHYHLVVDVVSMIENLMFVGYFRGILQRVSPHHVGRSSRIFRSCS